MPSPQIEAAAASTRTESEVRALRPVTMLDTIRAGVKRELTKACPFCGADPLPPAEHRWGKDREWGHFAMRCENEGCDADLTITADTAAEVLRRWNRRAT